MLSAVDQFQNCFVAISRFEVAARYDDGPGVLTQNESHIARHPQPRFQLFAVSQGQLDLIDRPCLILLWRESYLFDLGLERIIDKGVQGHLAGLTACQLAHFGLVRRGREIDCFRVDDIKLDQIGRSNKLARLGRADAVNDPRNWTIKRGVAQGSLRCQPGIIFDVPVGLGGNAAVSLEIAFILGMVLDRVFDILGVNIRRQVFIKSRLFGGRQVARVQAGQ